MRLEGRRIAHVNGYNITSDAIAPGSIQVPGNGQPIALLADRQTTGGYPKIATVISADVPALGRLPIGAKIRFERVTIERAQELRRIMANETELIGDKIVPITRSSADSDVVPKLSAHNLISGVVNAGDWVI
jgi:allophanate hydrolase subunit 2